MTFKIFDESTWPLDNPDEVSIGHAFQIAGRWKFPEKWDEVTKVASSPFISALPSLDNATLADRQRAWLLLPESKTRKPPIVTTSRGSSIYFTSQDWRRAADALGPEIAAQQDSYRCLHAARLAIRDECLSGNLEAYAQIYNGTTLVIKPHIWKTERFLRWFSTGRGSMLEVLDQPFSSDEPTLWVFFNRAQIRRAFPPADDPGGQASQPTAYKAKAVSDWLASYWEKFDGTTLHTFSDGKLLAVPRFNKDFTPAINEAFPNISTGIIRRSWDDRPPHLGGRRHRD